MRKYQKNKCFNVLGVLREVHNEIIKYIGNGQEKETTELLEQCQQAAISIGTTVEQAEGEGTKAVRYLEEYCELIYQLYEGFVQKSNSNSRTGYWHKIGDLEKLLDKISHCFKHEISTQYEAVFLPYKASMWDSLESVWRAAREDPDCNAVVIPIPYYDKAPDGSFVQLHYELDKFPLDVPVMEYSAYDFEVRHPDMIFIHNPYDDGNYVTSVDPFFYSGNLKQYTEKLIYIPYFVLGEIDPDNQKAVEGMEHFCLAAGVVNADYVVVQSEAMRQVYVDVLVKYTGEGKRAYWEKKILGLGSPKVDRVCSLRSEDFELPKDWERLILSENGRRKKVIFYNTSVSALLKNGEAMLEKIKENFRIFQESREDIVLLWRPHPLSEATLSSMRPHLLAEYEEIVKAYQKEAWGIYDDSPNVDRAIAVSDAYYGDWSSIVWLYQKTGKPVMIQNIDV